MKRIVLRWQGPSVVGLAVSVLHFDEDVLGLSAAVFSAVDNLHPLLPEGTSITVPDNGEFIDPTTGNLTGVWTESGTGGTKLGSGGALSAAGVGACITWSTGQIVGTRRLRGRTFIVPLSTGVYEANGTLTAAAVGALQEFANDLVATDLHVWHRPTTSGGSDGVSWPVTTGTVRDKVAFLSSRRD